MMSLLFVSRLRSTTAFVVHRTSRHHHLQKCSSRLFTQQQQQLSTRSTLIGLDWVQTAVVQVLNDLYDPKEVAKGAVLAKLNNNKKEKKQSKQLAESEVTTSQPDNITADNMDQLVRDAAANAPSSFSVAAAMVTPATRPEHGDYQVNAAMGLAKSLNLSSRDWH
jgi:hypothetical protein